MSTTTVEISGLTLDVSYSTHRGFPGSWEEPPEDPETEINSVRCAGQELLEILSEEAIKEIVNQIETIH